MAPARHEKVLVHSIVTDRIWVDVDDVTFVRHDESTGDQYVTRWPEGGEFVRRGTSATTVGPPEPYTDLLV